MLNYARMLLTLTALLLVSLCSFAQQATTPTPTQMTTATPVQKKRPMSIEQRQRRQQRRIAQGVQSGQLTGKEASRLEKREAGIERREQKMRASGGKFTPGERKAIQKQLDSTSQQIYKEKHDKQHQ